MASFSPAARVLVVLLATLGSAVSIASASVDDAGFSPEHAQPLAAPAPSASTTVLPRKVFRPAAGQVTWEDHFLSPLAATGVDEVRPHRVTTGCAGAQDISISQGWGTALPSGIPSYTVEAMNRCIADGGGCAIGGIHGRCGWFSSVTLVDPRKFLRLAYDDCLVNGGQPLLAGETISFEYANSFPCELRVAFASCVHPPPATSH
ncbi:TPD1 protein homolog 1A-like [Triticum urartu]|uniref:TPD1 protein homolog 1A-like n=1 Tax=Triticum urartu TaxID=4572 RepID=UPI0020434C63|nr:TPD1 protein homolog 1A-like [Triticum urartu]